jgi:dolichyl-phosphate-mannose-protein mannosyltransferase
MSAVTASSVLDAPPPPELPQPQAPPALEPREIPLALRPTLPTDRIRGLWVTVAIVIIAGFTRFWAVGWPREKIFDEAYYATEAQELLRYGYEDNRGYMFIVHPSVGKWLIAMGAVIVRSGNDTVGWRMFPALAGILCVLMLTRITRRITGSTLLGAIAGLLLTLEGVSLVMSRTALLDIFLPLFLLAAFGSLVLDRDAMRARLAFLYSCGVDLSQDVPTLGPRPWRLVAGVCLGLALGVKWSASSFAVVFVLMSLWWDRGALKSAGARHPLRATLRCSVPFAAGSLAIAPLVTYLLTWTGWFVGENSWNRYYAAEGGKGVGATSWWFPSFIADHLPGPLRSLIDYHYNAYQFHEHLYSPHTYGSSPWSWLILGRPVSYYYPSNPTGCSNNPATKCAREILLIGTPLLWWAFVPALLWCVWHWATTRDWRAEVVLLTFAAGWLVWLKDPKRTMFLFYMTPLIPFLILGLTLAIGVFLRTDIRRPLRRYVMNDEASGDDAGGEDAELVLPPRPWARIIVCVYLGVVVANFIWMWPIFTGGLLTYDAWHARMWFTSWI